MIKNTKCAYKLIKFLTIVSLIKFYIHHFILIIIINYYYYLKLENIIKGA